MATKITKKPLLIHHRHSFKLVHHRHTSYPLVFFMLMICGLLTFAWTSVARGASYNVNAIVPANDLTQPAIIDEPLDGAVFTTDTTTISGTCPDDSYVKVFRNQVFAGTALCQPDNTWSVKIQLVAGSNRIDAQDYNVTDKPGPSSPAVTVTYAAPQTNDPSEPAITNPSRPTPEAANEPLPTPADTVLLTSNYTYRGLLSGAASKWLFTINGGNGPYAISVDWGDGETNLKSLKQAGDFELEHTYTYGGGYNNSYTITVTASDVNGQKTLLQLFVIVTPSATGGASSGLTMFGSGGAADGSTTNNGSSTMQQFWKVAAPVYGVTVIAAASFWLGELHQVGQLGAQLHRFRFPWHWRF